MSGAIHTLLQYAFMARCLVKTQGQLYLLPFTHSSVTNDQLHNKLTLFSHEQHHSNLIVFFHAQDFIYVSEYISTYLQVTLQKI